MEVSKDLFTILFQGVIAGLAWVEDTGYHSQFLAQTNSATLEEMQAMCRRECYQASQYTVRCAIEALPRQVISVAHELRGHWTPSQFLPGEYIELDLGTDGIVLLVKDDPGERFWVAHAEGCLAEARGRFVRLGPSDSLGAGGQVRIEGQYLHVERLRVLSGNSKMHLLDALLTPSLYLYPVAESLSYSLLMPLYDALSSLAPGFLLPLDCWMALGRQAQGAGFSAFTLWHLMNDMGRNHSLMPL